MSILIQLENNQIKKEYPPIIILVHFDFALNTFFQSDQVIFSTSNDVSSGNPCSKNLSNNSLDSVLIVDKIKQIFQSLSDNQSFTKSTTLSLFQIFFINRFFHHESCSNIFGYHLSKSDKKYTHEGNISLNSSRLVYFTDSAYVK
jgi:hypothetical protein